MISICNANYNSINVLNKKHQTKILSNSKLIDYRINNENFSANLNVVKKQVNFTGISEKIGAGMAKAFPLNFINSKGLHSAAKIAAKEFFKLPNREQVNTLI